jgi:hypothetical protein
VNGVASGKALSTVMPGRSPTDNQRAPRSSWMLAAAFFERRFTRMIPGCVSPEALLRLFGQRCRVRIREQGPI